MDLCTYKELDMLTAPLGDGGTDDYGASPVHANRAHVTRATHRAPRIYAPRGKTATCPTPFSSLVLAAGCRALRAADALILQLRRAQLHGGG